MHIPTPGSNASAADLPIRHHTIMRVRGMTTDTVSIQVFISVIPDSTDRGSAEGFAEASVEAVEDFAAKRRTPHS
jgi:hypothetical protein